MADAGWLIGNGRLLTPSMDTMHTKQQTSFTLVAKVFKDGEHNGDALAISLFSKVNDHHLRWWL